MNLVFNKIEYTLILSALVVLFFLGVVIGMVISIPTIEDSNEAIFSISNGVGEHLNVTVFVLNGGDWNKIPVSIANNTTQALAVTWQGEGGVNVHVVYDDWDSNERILRYYVQDGENQIVMLC